MKPLKLTWNNDLEFGDNVNIIFKKGDGTVLFIIYVIQFFSDLEIDFKKFLLEFFQYLYY